MFFEHSYKNNREEYWNIISHLGGLIMAIIGMVVMLIKVESGKLFPDFIAVLIFGTSSIIVYLASSYYHYKWNAPTRVVYRTIDHITIYYLIAGTYTPFLLITFDPDAGWSLLTIIWGLAFAGTIFKLFFTGKFENLSLLFYVIMGWTVMLELDSFIETTPTKTLSLIMAGGLLYCIGVIFYRWNSIKYNHAIWHLFVVAANICHLIAVYTIL